MFWVARVVGGAIETAENFSPIGKSPEAIEQIKLEDGIRLHESVKVELETYARQTGRAIVKPFMLIIARDTTHAAQLAEKLKALFDGRYADKVIQVDSSVREEETVSRLLKVESADEPTEIVIHVNMLKEGWDVANLYTIVPLRAANARTLIEQSIGRGLRLPYGKRTGVTAVDRLNIVAHDRFQEILEEARRPDSAIRLREVVMSGGELERPLATMVSRPRLMDMLGVASESGLREEAAEFQPEDQPIAALAHDVILQLERRASGLPSIAHLQTADVQAAIRREVEARYQPQMELQGVTAQPDIADIVARTADLVVRQTIDIPTMQVFPKGAVRSGFRPFTLDLAGLRYEPPSETLWIEHLRTGRIEKVGVRAADHDEIRLEDYVVNGLVGIDDVSYDDNADLLYDLAGQVTRHLLAHLPEGDARKVLRFHQPEIARFVHAQMTAHYWQEADAGYETIFKRQTKGLISRVYTGERNAPRADFRSPPPDRSHMARYVFGGFARGLYATEKFQSDAERKLAVILDRDTQKWFKPAAGQFDLTYRIGAEDRDYQPDFVAEMPDAILMLEPKAANQLADPEVLAKRDVAAEFCRQATLHNDAHGGKPWSYLLIPHDAIAGNMTVANLAQLYAVGRA